MPVYFVGDNPISSFYEAQIPNGKYRYLGRWKGISYEIHSKTRKTKEELFDYLQSRSVDSLVNCEGVIVNID